MRYSLILLMLLVIFSCNESTENTGDVVPPDQFSEYDITVVAGDTIAKLPGSTIDYIEIGKISNGKKQGFWLERRDRTPTRPKSMKYYVDGKLNGPFYTYGNNGYPKISANYKNGKLHGDYIKYNNGSPLEISYFVNGKIDGKQTIYYEDFDNRTSVKKTAEYDMGVLDGKLTWYNPEGEVTMEYIYKDGEKVSGGIVEKK